MNTLKKRKCHTAEEKLKLLDEFFNSDLTVQKFVALKGIGESTFMRWRCQFKTSGLMKNQINGAPTNPSPLFVELTPSFHSEVPTTVTQVHDQKNSQPVGCIICVPNGITVKLESLVIDQLALVVKGLLP